jgi:predicted DNA-binding transcriptional regulator AlpA
MGTPIIQDNYRAKDMQRLLGISSSTLYDLISRGLLPRPIKLGRSSIWLREEVEACIEERKNAREAG